MKTKRSPYGKLAKLDFWKGLLLSFSSGAIGTVYEVLKNVNDLSKINYNTILTAGILAALAYLQIKFFSNSNGTPYKKEPKQ